MKNNIGIYRITNLINNRFYIGSSIDISRRWNEHKRNLSKNNHTNNFLQKCWNKYGENNFIFEILEIVSDKFKLIEREQFYLDKLKEQHKDDYYNICLIAGNMLGFKHSEKTKSLMSEQRKGNKYSLGYKHTYKSREEMSNSHTGSKHNESTIIKLIDVSKKNNLKNIKYKTNRVPEHLKIKIIEDYKTGKLSTRKLSELYNISKSTIWNIIRI